MKYIVMVIAIGDIFWKAPAKEVLVHYFEKYEIPYVFIEEDPVKLNPKGVAPSWLKMICHRILPDYDAIICWDLDLLPASPDIRVMDMFDMTKICLAKDCLAMRMAANKTVLPYCPEFKYNGGLICIPKPLKNFTEVLFDKFAPGTLPWWEQCYLNNIIGAFKLPVHELPSDINIFYTFEGFDAARLQHYTCGLNAKEAILVHKERYLKHGSIK
jgi:hypothetical protein